MSSSVEDCMSIRAELNGSSGRRSLGVQVESLASKRGTDQKQGWPSEHDFMDPVPQSYEASWKSKAHFHLEIVG